MKIALVAPDDFSLWIFRKRLIQILRNGGHDIYTIANNEGYLPRLEALGVTHLPVNMQRFVSPKHDFHFLVYLYNLFKSHNFDIVHSFTIKPNIYASLAAKTAGVKNIFASITGLGVLAPGSPKVGIKSGILRRSLLVLHWAVLKGCTRVILKGCTRVWVQNEDDLNFLLSRNLISPKKAVLIKGSGVDLSYFSPTAIDPEKVAKLRQSLNDDGSCLYVSMVTRPLINKGVHEFIAASELLSIKYPNLKFILVGGLEESNPLSVSEEYLLQKRSPNFIWLGFREEIREIQAISDISVLPSYYPEGIPRNLLEAMAMGNPIITTDHVGCREVVEDGKNGYLVPTRNAHALARVLDDLISSPEKRMQFGAYSRVKVEEEYDEKTVAEKLITQLYRLDLK